MKNCVFIKQQHLIFKALWKILICIQFHLDSCTPNEIFFWRNIAFFFCFVKIFLTFQYLLKSVLKKNLTAYYITILHVKLIPFLTQEIFIVNLSCRQSVIWKTMIGIHINNLTENGQVLHFDLWPFS